MVFCLQKIKFIVQTQYSLKMRKWGRNNDKRGHINKKISLENRNLNGEFGLQRNEAWVIINTPTTSEYLIIEVATIWFIINANGMSIMLKQISGV